MRLRGREGRFSRKGGAELTDEPRDPAPGERDAEIDLGNREPGALRRNADVARRCHDEATADAVPVNCGDRQRLISS